MKGFCGWFSNQPIAAGDSALAGMLAASRTAVDDADSREGVCSALAAFGAPARPRIVEVDGLSLVVCGYPRLGRGARRSADLQELARAFRLRGAEVLADLGGDFSLAAWDEARRRGLLAVDRIGVHQLVYASAGPRLAFASTLDTLAGLPGLRRELSPQGIFDYLYYHVSPGPQTVIAGWRRVPPGHRVDFGPGGVEPAAPYWSVQFREERDARPETLKQEFLALLEDAVAEAAYSANCGAFLSGGTDSSTVSGMLSRIGPAAARTFSIGFDAEGYDEMEYARIAAKHFGCEHHEYYVTPQDVVDAVPRIAAAYDQPFGNASAIPTYYCAKFAREHGIERLLAGDGGDELFGGNERYAKHHLLGLYQNVPAGLRRTVVEPLLLSMPQVQHVPGLRKLRSYVEQARPPMPLRYESYNLLMHLGNAQVFTPEFLARIDVDHPHELLNATHAPHANASLINQMLAIDLRFVLADGDLPKVTRMCDLAGADVAFPMLDDRLIEFSMSLPADLKLRGTQLRWFFKDALKDFLPPAVITKKKHGFGLPVGTWLVGHQPLYDLASDSIALLRDRGIVQPRFIDELLGVRLREHPAYFGTMVWVLMMLGLWLESRKL